MNEVSSVSPEAEVPVRPSVSAGRMLRQAREAAGLDIAVLAGMLKVPVAKLEALELENFSVYNDMVFMRGLASSACRVLKVPVADVLAAMPQSAGATLHTVGSQRMREVRFDGSDAGGLRRSGPSQWLRGPRAVVVVALLAGAGLFALWPFIQDQRSQAEGAETAEVVSSTTVAVPDLAPATIAPATVAATPASVSEPVAASAVVPAAPAAAAAPESKPAQAAAENVAPSASSVSGSEAKNAENQAAPAVNAPATEAAADAPLLRLRARAESWVQIRTTAGEVVTQRLLKVGETMDVAHPGPLSVTIGRADSTEVFVRGEVRDIATSARDNVARFEVK